MGRGGDGGGGDVGEGKDAPHAPRVARARVSDRALAVVSGRCAVSLGRFHLRPG